jgi:hypothetical protein
MDDVVVTGKLKLKKKSGGVTKKHVKHAEFPSWANYAVEIAQQAVNPSKYKPAPIANRSAADVEATASSFAAPHERKKTKAELDKEKSDTNAKRVLKKVGQFSECCSHVIGFFKFTPHIVSPCRCRNRTNGELTNSTGNWRTRPSSTSCRASIQSKKLVIDSCILFAIAHVYICR